MSKIWIGSGSDVLDLVVGGGAGYGYPAGKIINIIGDSGSGKTVLACEVIASAYHRYHDKLKWVYDDCESGFTFDTQKMYGFEIIPIEVEKRFKSQTVQELYGNVRKFIDTLKKDEFGVYVCDSLDGLSSNELNDLGDTIYKDHLKGKTTEKGSYQMESAKFLSQIFFRTITPELENKNILFIVINQVRYNTDRFSFQKFVRAGGKALDFYAYCALWLSNIDQIEHKGVPIGVVLKAQAKKLKAPRPYRNCTFSLLFDYGIDNTGSNLDFLYDLRGKQGELLKAAKEISWKDEEPMGREELVFFIEQNKQQKELRALVREKWEETEEKAKVVRSSKYEEESE